MKKKFNFPVIVSNNEWDGVSVKRDPIFCFKDDCYLDARYADWRTRCFEEREANQRPVSAKERAESTFAEPMVDWSTLMNPSDGRQPQ